MSETRDLPTFDAPPVVETAISAQFEPLPNFTNAHSGWFWKNYLEQEWSSVKPAPRIKDVSEAFGENRRWSLPGDLSISHGLVPDRLQIICAKDDEDRMIQIQDSRFIYNWRRGANHSYPSYRKLLPEFEAKLELFDKFVHEAALGKLDFNLWELVYVNHIPKGELWSSIRDWPSVLPSLLFPQLNSINNQQPDSLRLEWQFVIGENIGRLYVSVAHARQLGPGQTAEIMEIKLMARGPIDLEQGIDLVKGLGIGHMSIVKTFAQITSAKAHEHWKRKT